MAPCRLCKSAACTTNDDGYVISIQTSLSSSKCKGLACHIGQEKVTSITDDRHLGNGTIWIEEAPVQRVDAYDATGVVVKTEYFFYRWTDQARLFKQTVPDTGAGPRDPVQHYAYLPTIMLHELGHALGLSDLYKEPGGYPSYLMGTLSSSTVTTIPMQRT